MFPCVRIYSSGFRETSNHLLTRFWNQTGSILMIKRSLITSKSVITLPSFQLQQAHPAWTQMSGRSTTLFSRGFWRFFTPLLSGISQPGLQMYTIIRSKPRVKCWLIHHGSPSTEKTKQVKIHCLP